MYLNTHSWFSLKYGTLSPVALADMAVVSAEAPVAMAVVSAEVLVATATRESVAGKQQVVTVTCTRAGEPVFEGRFTCFVLPEHVLGRDPAIDPSNKGKQP